MAVAKIAGNFDRATNPYPNPTDFAHEIRIRRMRILAGSVTSLTTATQQETERNIVVQTLNTAVNGDQMTGNILVKVTRSARN